MIVSRTTVYAQGADRHVYAFQAPDRCLLIAFFNQTTVFTMKNAMFKTLSGLLPLFLLLGLLIPVHAGAPLSIETTCPAPDVSVTEQTASSVTFGWSAVSGASQYRIWYVRREDNYSSQVTTTGGTSATFSNMPSGTYDFYFQTSCGVEGNSAIIVADLLI